MSADPPKSPPRTSRAAEGEASIQVRVDSVPIGKRSTREIPRIVLPEDPRILVLERGQLPELLKLACSETVPPIDVDAIGLETLPDRLGAAYAALFVAASEDDENGVVEGICDQIRAASVRLPVVVVATANADNLADARRCFHECGAAATVARDDVAPSLVDAVLSLVAENASLRRQLVLTREDFSQAIRGANDAMWEWDLGDDTVFYSQRWQELLGIQKELEHSLEVWLDRVNPHDRPRLESDLQRFIASSSTVYEGEHRVRRDDGTHLWVLCRATAARGEDGRAQRLAGSLTDISGYRAREQRLRDESRRDALTDLPRQDVLFEKLARAVELSLQHSDSHYAVLMVNVDRLGIVRDSFGREAADGLLPQIADRLKTCVGEGGMVSRYDGSAFAILLSDLEVPHDGPRLASRIHDAMADAFEIGEHRVFVTVSIGLTSSARGYNRVDDVMTDVLAALNYAQDRGPNRREVFHTNMRIEAITLLRLEMALREAIEQHQFELYYQPIVDLPSQKLCGFEALLRWHHPQRGFVSPGEFIPVAENTGLIAPIGRWAIMEVARQIREWGRAFNLSDEFSVSVNLSGRQTADHYLVQAVDEALHTTGIDPRKIKIELTESVLMENANAVTAMLESLRGRGLRTYIDDFGTGYSSLGYLHRFPVDGLKIDRTFVTPLNGTDASATMVRTILDLAGNLDVDVVAEGIEEIEQAEQLAAMGCPKAQGYYFGRPAAAHTHDELLAKIMGRR